MFSGFTDRADITATSNQVNFAAVSNLMSHPIRLWAASGRMAVLQVNVPAASVSGTAGTKYIYASLTAPAGDPYSTSPSNGLLHKLLSVTFSRSYIYEAVRCVHPGDGSVVASARNSDVSLVVSTSAVAPDTHHIPLGEVVWSGSAITALVSYQSEATIAIAGVLPTRPFLTAAAANSPAANGAVLQRIDGTNECWYQLVFTGAASTTTSAYWEIPPVSIGSIRIVWRTSGTSGDIKWNGVIRDKEDADVLGGGTIRASGLVVDSAKGTANLLNECSMTISYTPGANKRAAILQIFRNTGDGPDTLTPDANILTVECIE